MALTFTPLGDLGVRIVGAAAPLNIFPSTKDADAKEITLFSVPEEAQREGVISWPGEYNKAGVSFKGIGHGDSKHVSFIVTIEGIRCAFLSSPLQDWTDKQLEAAGDIDVLVLPTDNAKVAQKILDEFDPRVVILLPGDNRGAFDSIAKILGTKASAAVAEYKLKSQLPAEGREVVVLEK